MFIGINTLCWLIASIITGNYIVMALGVMMVAWGLLQRPRKPTVWQWSVFDESEPVQVVMQPAVTADEAIAAVARDVFGLHAECSYIEATGDDLLAVK